MKRTLCLFFTSIVLMLSLSIECFATFKADGFLSSEEITTSKIQIHCDKGDSGNKVQVLTSYYNIYKDDKQIYIALSGDFNGEEINKENGFGIIVSINGKPKIYIKNNGEKQYDEQYFYVESKCKNIYASFKAELVIIYKFPVGDTPKITFQITDDENIDSRIFDLDTSNLPTTQTETTTLKPTEKEAINKSNKTKKRKPRKQNYSAGTGKKDEKTTEKETTSEVEETTENIYVKKPTKIVLDSKVEEEQKKAVIHRAIFISLSLGLLVTIITTIIFVNVKNSIAKAKQKEWEKKHKD